MHLSDFIRGCVAVAWGRGCSIRRISGSTIRCPLSRRLPQVIGLGIENLEPFLYCRQVDLEQKRSVWSPRRKEKWQNSADVKMHEFVEREYRVSQFAPQAASRRRR